MDKRVNEIMNVQIDYREKLNLDENVTMGLEIEYKKIWDKIIKLKINKNGLDKWKNVYDESVAFKIYGQYFGGEINSPILKDNEKVVIFPEGKTHKVIEAVPFKGGVAKIATMANRPLVPFGINGNYNPFSKISITFGKPIDLKSIPKDEWDITLEETVRTLEKR